MVRVDDTNVASILLSTTRRQRISSGRVWHVIVHSRTWHDSSIRSHRCTQTPHDEKNIFQVSHFLSTRRFRIRLSCSSDGCLVCHAVCIKQNNIEGNRLGFFLSFTMIRGIHRFPVLFFVFLCLYSTEFATTTTALSTQQQQSSFATPPSPPLVSIKKKMTSFYQRPLPSTCIAFSSPLGRRIFASALQNGGLKSFFAL